MNQSNFLFGEVRTCQNPCAAAGVILWTTEPNQPAESLAVSLPGPLACLSSSHFFLEHNTLLCQLLQKTAVVLSFRSQKTRSEHCAFLCFGGSCLCSCSQLLGLHQRGNLCLQKSTQANGVHYNQFFLLNQFGRQGITPVSDKPESFRAAVAMLIFGECQLKILMALSLGEK